jgi:hypothetical protein
VIVQIVIVWVVTLCGSVDINVSEEHIASIFRADMCRVRNRLDYVGTNQFPNLHINGYCAKIFLGHQPCQFSTKNRRFRDIRLIAIENLAHLFAVKASNLIMQEDYHYEEVDEVARKFSVWSFMLAWTSLCLLSLFRGP